MSYDAIEPPTNLIADFQSLQLTIADDHTGDRTRQLHSYLLAAQDKCHEMLVRTPATDFEQRTFTQMLMDAFGASRAIVLAAWKKAHGADLAT